MNDSIEKEARDQVNLYDKLMKDIETFTTNLGKEWYEEYKDFFKKNICETKSEIMDIIKDTSDWDAMFLCWATMHRNDEVRTRVLEILEERKKRS